MLSQNKHAKLVQMFIPMPRGGPRESPAFFLLESQILDIMAQEHNFVEFLALTQTCTDADLRVVERRFPDDLHPSDLELHRHFWAKQILKASADPGA